MPSLVHFTQVISKYEVSYVMNIYSVHCPTLRSHLMKPKLTNPTKKSLEAAMQAIVFHNELDLMLPAKNAVLSSFSLREADGGRSD